MKRPIYFLIGILAVSHLIGCGNRTRGQIHKVKEGIENTSEYTERIKDEVEATTPEK